MGMNKGAHRFLIHIYTYIHMNFTEASLYCLLFLLQFLLNESYISGRELLPQLNNRRNPPLASIIRSRKVYIFISIYMYINKY
jgi:hypothetical protein